MSTFTKLNMALLHRYLEVYCWKTCL